MKNKHRSILSSAEHEFLEKGYDGTSIDAIVKEVGGSKSTIYAHFQDKAVLFSETLANITGQLDFGLQAARLPEGPTLARLSAIGAAWLSTLYAQRTLHLLRTVIAEARRFPEVAGQLVSEGLAVAESRLAEVISAEMDSGHLRSADPVAAASAFAGLLQGSGYLLALLSDEAVPSTRLLATQAESAADAFLRAYSAG